MGPDIKDVNSVTAEESQSAFHAIQEYLKSDIVDEEAAASEEQVLDIDSIVTEYVRKFTVIYSHNKNEILYLLKIILGLAMQGPDSSEMAKRITSLPKLVQDILMQLIQEVLATMNPEGVTTENAQNVSNLCFEQSSEFEKSR